MHSFSPTAPALLNQAIARIVGREASILGYPMIEMLRTCKLQTRGRGDWAHGQTPPIDSIFHGSIFPVGRPLRSPCDNLHYSCAWLWLSQGARHIVLPRSAAFADCAYLFSFYDAFSEHIATLSDADARDDGVILISPHTERDVVGPDFHVIQSPTDLVWMVGRILDSAHAPAQHRLLQSALRVDGPAGTLTGRRPAAVDLWEGDISDPFMDLAERRVPSHQLAPAFFTNLCRALTHVRVPASDRALVSAIRGLGLSLDSHLNWDRLDTAVREGLAEGLADAAHTVSRCANLKIRSSICHRVTRREFRLARAIRAYSGLGIHEVETAVTGLIIAGNARENPAETTE